MAMQGMIGHAAQCHEQLSGEIHWWQLLLVIFEALSVEVARVP
jgi:hypothetical protein